VVGSCVESNKQWNFMQDFEFPPWRCLVNSVEYNFTFRQLKSRSVSQWYHICIKCHKTAFDGNTPA